MLISKISLTGFSKEVRFQYLANKIVIPNRHIHKLHQSFELLVWYQGILLKKNRDEKKGKKNVKDVYKTRLKRSRKWEKKGKYNKEIEEKEN